MCEVPSTLFAHVQIPCPLELGVEFGPDLRAVLPEDDGHHSEWHRHERQYAVAPTVSELVVQ